MGKVRVKATVGRTAASVVCGSVAVFGLAGVGITTLGPSAFAASGPAPVCASGTCTVTFLETGAPAAWTVPPGVSSAAVTLTGGAGGEAGGVDFSHRPGGLGATVDADIPVAAGDTYSVVVGGAAPGDGSEAGGYNGGGGLPDSGNAVDLSGGGGGMSDLTLSGMPVLVAGGGGGAGADGEGNGPLGADGASGGNGGASASVGDPGATDSSGTGGGGGGGQPGTAGGGGDPGAPGAGLFHIPASGQGTAGQGGSAQYDLLGGGGGGGGGGYFGGGGGGGGNIGYGLDSNGGGGGGGGGGSDYVTPSALSSTVTDGTSSGNGQITITYTDPITVSAYTATTTLNTALAGNLTSTATVPDGDTITATAVDPAPAHGTVAINPDGTFTYKPDTGYTGVDTFGYQLTDSAGDSATGVATITVNRTPAWAGKAASGYPAQGAMAAEGFYIGNRGDGWRLEVTHPGTTAENFSGTIAINTGAFANVHGIQLEPADTYTANSGTITFAFRNQGRVDGLNFVTPPQATSITFTLDINGAPATTTQIYLGTKLANPTTNPYTATRRTT